MTFRLSERRAHAAEQRGGYEAPSRVDGGDFVEEKTLLLRLDARMVFFFLFFF